LKGKPGTVEKSVGTRTFKAYPAHGKASLIVSSIRRIVSDQGRDASEQSRLASSISRIPSDTVRIASDTSRFTAGSCINGKAPPRPIWPCLLPGEFHLFPILFAGLKERVMERLALRENRLSEPLPPLFFCFSAF